MAGNPGRRLQVVTYGTFALASVSEEKAATPVGLRPIRIVNPR